MITFHPSIDVRKAIAALRSGHNMFDDADVPTALKHLLEHRAIGYSHYTGCDRVDNDGRCKGHKDKKTKK